MPVAFDLSRQRSTIWNTVAEHADDFGRRALSGHSQSLERGLAILSTLASGPPLVGISDLARAVELSRSTAHRYVSTLTRLGYLDQDPATRKYRLGPRVLDLGFSAINSMELREIAAPYLQQLSDETGHTVNMAILDEVDVVYIERCRASQQGQREIDLNLHVGSRLPAYCTSLGKVLLAFLPAARRQALLDRIEFVRRGPNTLMSKTALSAELATIRAQGVAVSNEEMAYGLRSMAMPVSSQTGEAAAAVNLAVHRSLVSMEDLVVRLSPALQRTVDEISRRLGHRST
jgi:IclR family pca regulon transcriptional regulator